MDLEQLYKTYEKPIYSYLYALTGDAHQAEELVQETFYQVVRSVYRFRGDSHVTTWLYGVARNVYHSWQRRKGRCSSQYDDEKAATARSVESDPVRMLIRKEGADLIRLVLLSLPERYREALLLRDYQGLHYRELAVITGLTLSSVKVTIHRARRRFRELYDAKGVMDDD